MIVTILRHSISTSVKNPTFCLTKCFIRADHTVQMLLLTYIFVVTGVKYWSPFPASSCHQITSESLPGIDLMIAIGVIIMVLGFLGCCGAIRENRCMLLLVGIIRLFFQYCLIGHFSFHWKKEKIFFVFVEKHSAKAPVSVYKPVHL